MYKKYKLHKSDDGQSLVEFALLLPVLMIILLGIVEFGFMFNAKISLNSAVREGARVYAITNDKNLVVSAIDLTMVNLGDYVYETKIDDIIEIHYTNGIIKLYYDNLVGSPDVKMANVNITGHVDFLTNFFDGLLSERITMVSTAGMRVEHDLLTTGGE